MDEKGTPHTRDNTMPVNGEEYREGLLISVAVGAYYTLNAYLPILVYYAWRKDVISSMTNNSSYKFAWELLYGTHFFTFLPMALLWPFTYIGSAVIVDFYDVANWYLGTLAAGSIYLTVATAFILAALLYEDTTAVSSTFIWQEMILYIVLETLAWYTSVYEYPKAHRQFYYAFFIDIGEENKI